MSSSTTSADFGPAPLELQPCSVAILYDDGPSRTRAIQLCDHLVREFWRDMQFRLNWWKTAHLGDADLSQAAAWSVRHAQIVVVAAVNRAELPAGLAVWLDKALHNPMNGDRMLIGFGADPAAEKDGASPLLRGLQECAMRAGMDFLPRLTADPMVAAAQLTRHSNEGVRAVLQGMLERPLTPPSQLHD